MEILEKIHEKEKAIIKMDYLRQETRNQQY